MKEQLHNGNLFLLPKHIRDAAVVTTNGDIKVNGSLVMGAGIAKYCRDTHAGIDSILGRLVRENGNHAYYLGAFYDRNRQDTVNVISMPTKDHWRNNSDLSLIRRSCKELTAIADKYDILTMYMPPCGCANGHLDYKKQVRPILMDILDDRFCICLPYDIWKTVQN